MKTGVGSGVTGTELGIRIRTKMSRVPNTVFVQLELGGLAVLAEYTLIPTRLERLSSPAALPGLRLAHYLPEYVR